MVIVLCVLGGFLFLSYCAYCSCADKAENENYQKARAKWLAEHPNAEKSWGWQGGHWSVGRYTPVSRQEPFVPPPLPPESRLEKIFNWMVDCLIPEMPPPSQPQPRNCDPSENWENWEINWKDDELKSVEEKKV